MDSLAHAATTRAAKNVAELSAGTAGLKRATLDSIGPLSQSVAYRLNLMIEEGDSRSSPLNSRRWLIAGTRLHNIPKLGTGLLDIREDA